MSPDHQMTPEEKALYQPITDQWDSLSEPARAVLRAADVAAYGAHMVLSYSFSDEDYDEAIEKMSLAAAEITEREHKLLATFWRAALAAAASIDSEDFETHVGFRVWRGDLHHFYRMLSSMVEKVLREKRLAEEKRIAERKKRSKSFNPKISRISPSSVNTGTEGTTITQEQFANWESTATEQYGSDAESVIHGRSDRPAGLSQ